MGGLHVFSAILTLAPATASNPASPPGEPNSLRRCVRPAPALPKKRNADSADEQTTNIRGSYPGYPGYPRFIVSFLFFVALGGASWLTALPIRACRFIGNSNFEFRHFGKGGPQSCGRFAGHTPGRAGARPCRLHEFPVPPHAFLLRSSFPRPDRSPLERRGRRRGRSRWW
jgi:hypothetical protein